MPPVLFAYRKWGEPLRARRNEVSPVLIEQRVEIRFRNEVGVMGVKPTRKDILPQFSKHAIAHVDDEFNAMFFAQLHQLDQVVDAISDSRS